MLAKHAKRLRILPYVFALCLGLLPGSFMIGADEFTLYSFTRQRLTDVYYSEGANAGDLNNDGHPDVVYGPYWFEGPTFQKKHEIYPAKEQNREKYADNFFNWVYDFNGDGWKDILVVGFPGTPGYVYENPKAGGFDKPWKKHQVLKAVSNESPQFTNVVGDPRPELLCTSEGRFGFASVNWENPFGEWKFHQISVRSAPKPFGHGLGVGDVNGDGRNDILVVNGWFEQPPESPETVRWEFHEAAFSNSYGGAEMYVYDVDGDGLNDVITSLAAHDFGLAWYKQEKVGGRTVFRQQLIVGDRPEQNRYGVVFSEPHSVALVDMDGDGLKDIVTGKTYYSHHKQSPMWDAGPVVYWFKLTRTGKGVDWIPHRIDGEAGIGRQISIVDLNGDKLPDVVVGGMRGCHVLVQKRQTVSADAWKAAQPQPIAVLANQTVKAPRSVLEKGSGKVASALEGEDLKILQTTAGSTSVQPMKGFTGDVWSGGKQLFWSKGKPGDRLDLELNVDKAGKYEIAGVFTMARDYAQVQVILDGKPLGKVLDCYNYPDVITTGVTTIGTAELSAGAHKLTLEIKGSNPSALKSYLVGLDYLVLRPATADASTSQSWRSLPLIKDGKVDPAWQQLGWGQLVVDNGSLRTECDERGLGLLLYQPEKFGNCQLRVVYRSKDARSNSGVYVRIDDGILKQIEDKGPAVQRTKDGKLTPESLKEMEAASEKERGPWYAVHHGYEVQICDEADTFHRTGAIYSLAKADAAPAASRSAWRTMIITLDGNRIKVELDGKQVSSFDSEARDIPERKQWHEPRREPKRPMVGYFGLQTHDPGDVVYFKEVSVRPLDATR